MDAKFYPTFAKNCDDSLFRDRILAKLTPESTVLDLGAGAGIVSQMNFSGYAARICGVDLDPRVEQNPFLDEGRVADGQAIPYPDASFDLVFADNVLEHLADPVSVFHEVSRVLRPGGRFLFKTPNKNHYMPLISRLTPHAFHRFVNRKRGRAEDDTFPTHYRANCLADVTSIAATVDFTVESIELIEGRPEYMRMFAAIYLVGIVYERLVNAIPVLERFRVVLIGTLRKEG